MDFIKKVINSFNQENIQILKRSFTDPSIYIDSSRKSREELKSYLYFSIVLCFLINIISSNIYELILGKGILDVLSIKAIFTGVIVLLLYFPITYIGIWINGVVLSLFKHKYIKNYTIYQLENMSIMALVVCGIIDTVGSGILDMMHANLFILLLWSFIVYIGFINMMVIKYHKNKMIEEL